MSVVVVSHNEGENLPRTIHRLLETMPVGGEIIVVDDSSTDGSGDATAYRYPSVRVVRAPWRLGAAAARNFGAIQSTGAIVVFADAHVMPVPGWFEAFASQLARPEVGAVGPSVYDLGNEAARGYGQTLIDPAMGITWLPARGGDPYDVPILGGFFLAARRDVLERTGGFDSGLIGWGGEDIEFSIRLWALGYECVIVPSLPIGHLFRTHHPYFLPAAAYTHNMLRVAAVHLGESRFACSMRHLSSWPAFPEAHDRFSHSDVWTRRAELNAERVHNDDWFCHRFQIRAFGDE